MNLNLFIRQSYTEAGEDERDIIQSVINLIKSMNNDQRRIKLLTGDKAYNQSNFKAAYEKESGNLFTPENFRKTRQSLIQTCDAMIIIRTGMSESTAFEVCYNIFSGSLAPMLFLVRKKNPIKTTLLQNLDEISDSTYVSFESAGELDKPVSHFIYRVAESKEKSHESITALSEDLEGI